MSGLSNIAEIRKDYKLRSLLEKDVDNNAIKQFDNWWHDAIKSNVEEPNAMTLATCTKSGKPSARVVLLKGFTNEGFIFFTNYKSKKGEQLDENANAALVFFWKELERQVRIEGTAKKLSDKESDEYFIMRPEQSRISAWSSPQSQVVKNRKVLEDNFDKYQQQFTDGAVVRPQHWGGYIIAPETIEYWQGRQNRLHDRLLYTLADSKWKIERLAP